MTAGTAYVMVPGYFTKNVVCKTEGLKYEWLPRVTHGVDLLVIWGVVRQNVDQDQENELRYHQESNALWVLLLTASHSLLTGDAKWQKRSH